MSTTFGQTGCAVAALAALVVAGLGEAHAARTDYIASVDVVPGDGSAADEGTDDTVTGVVFEDLSRDGVRQDDEPGIAGVMVSNGPRGRPDRRRRRLRGCRPSTT